MTDPLKYLFLFFVLIYQLCAQVPVAESQAESGEPIPVAQGEEAQVASGFGSGIFSDPEELANIDGLNEPMERLKLRDHDANMILDAIQMLTDRQNM